MLSKELGVENSPKNGDEALGPFSKRGCLWPSEKEKWERRPGVSRSSGVYLLSPRKGVAINSAFTGLSCT